MRILGIDPGYATVGFGIVEYDGYKFVPIEYGAFLTQADMDFPFRLKSISDDMDYALGKYRPDSIAIEKLFFNTNHKTAIDVSQARGVLVLCAVKSGIPIAEYTPLQVKQSVVGYGKAEKTQVMEMTKRLLRLSELPKPDDAADALAIAICHGHCCHSLLHKY
ncbi:MAG: crossover junction endodeoxyribonuclease RuvC [Oscillospiraceae bacterium]|nr:crossover junction endodeoxyribonuclease RuvC [Oscillospiraceae bacterium]